MPAARPDHDGGQLLVGLEDVGLAARLEVELAVERVAEVELAAHHVLPQRGVGVLEVGEPDLRSGVQRVDRHLAVRRAGDLDAAVLQAGSRLGHPPGVVVPDVGGVRREVQSAALGQLPLPVGAPAEQLETPGAELALEGGEKAERLRREDLRESIVDGAGQLHARGSSHPSH
jgi:hypothetical protein